MKIFDVDVKQFIQSILVIGVLSFNVFANAQAVEKSKEQLQYEERTQPLYELLLKSMYEKHLSELNAFAGQLQEFKETSQQLCLQGEGDDVLKAQWPELLASWAIVTALPTNALMEDNRLLKLESFPIRKGFIKKKLASFIKNHGGQINQENIQQQSVVLQGMPLIEYVLFSNQIDGDDVNAKQKCDLITSVVDNIHDINLKVKTETSDFLSNIDQLSFDETLMHLDDLINQLTSSIVELSKKRMNTRDFKEASADDGLKGYSMEHMMWVRSQQAYHYVEQRALTISGYLSNENYYSIDNFLLDIHYRGIGALLKKKANSLSNAANQMANIRYDMPVINENDFNRVADFYAQLIDLENYLTTAIFASINISKDFNSQDGD